MYPNTMEFSHPAKITPPITFSTSKTLGLAALIIGIVFMTIINLNAREVRPIQTQVLTKRSLSVSRQGNPKAFGFVKTQSPNDEEMNRLRINLQTNLVKDGIVAPGTERIKIIFRDDFISVNDRVLCFNHMHKYHAIFNAYGVSAGTHRAILLKDQSIIIGTNEDGLFIVD